MMSHDEAFCAHNIHFTFSVIKIVIRRLNGKVWHVNQSNELKQRFSMLIVEEVMICGFV